MEISAFVNIRRRPMTKWETLLKQETKTETGRMVYELIGGTKPDASETFMVRVTEVTGAGGFPVATETFADKFDALDRFNVVAGNIVTIA